MKKNYELSSVIGTVVTTYASTYTELKGRQEELVAIEGKISEIKEDIGELKANFKIMEKTLIEINNKLDKVVEERKWYKAAAGFVIAASTAIIAFIVFLISYSSEITAIKELLTQVIQKSA
ncbi:hypothetical protein L4F91_05215 [Avibacterium sp. 20-126]|uniref:hypothetical protein n=1 Tax=Avibacterium sp. 20-126 TaxID=2911524 RepID=UPI002186B692|nr:hypothetical protein L4F91_05215 [Avibacterium sp. 20-126]